MSIERNDFAGLSSTPETPRAFKDHRGGSALWRAFLNSLSALRHLAAHERAVRLELALLVVAIPLAWLLARSPEAFMLLVGSIVFVLIVEILNTGIEGACNAVTREFRDEIKIAKDCGSLAVLLSILVAAAIWMRALYLYFC